MTQAQEVAGAAGLSRLDDGWPDVFPCEALLPQEGHDDDRGN
jgi:hypothetical protein